MRKKPAVVDVIQVCERNPSGTVHHLRIGLKGNLQKKAGYSVVVVRCTINRLETDPETPLNVATEIIHS